MAVYSLRDVAERMDAALERRPRGLRALSRRVRWEWSWQGVGVLSLRCLLRTTSMPTFKAALRAIDAGRPPGSLVQAYQRLGFPTGNGVTQLPLVLPGLKRIAERIASRQVVPVRLLSYNTYLMPGVEIPLGRYIDDTLRWDALTRFHIPIGAGLLALFNIASIPGITIQVMLDQMGITPSMVINKVLGINLDSMTHFLAKPGWKERAPQIGRTAGAYDICCFSEVFNDDARHALRTNAEAQSGSPYQTENGPEANDLGAVGDSGLFFMARPKFLIHKTERKVYGNRGDKTRDADAWAEKGVLLNVVDVGVGHLEIFQTHLFYGGGLFGTISEDTRMSVWRDELKELEEFIRAHHRPENVALVTGDFNMNGANIRHYAELRKTFDGLGFKDQWYWDVYENMASEGVTCRYTDDGDPYHGNYETLFRSCQVLHQTQDRLQGYCDDTAAHAAPKAGVGRYDYLFLERPTRAHRFLVDTSRPLRKPFLIGRARDGTLTNMEGEVFLSDHIALDVSLYCHARQ